MYLPVRVRIGSHTWQSKRALSVWLLDMIPKHVFLNRLAWGQCVDRVSDEVRGYFILVHNHVHYDV